MSLLLQLVALATLASRLPRDMGSVAFVIAVELFPAPVEAKLLWDGMVTPVGAAAGPRRVSGAATCRRYRLNVGGPKDTS